MVIVQLSRYTEFCCFDDRVTGQNDISSDQIAMKNLGSSVINDTDLQLAELDTSARIVLVF